MKNKKTIITFGLLGALILGGFGFSTKSYSATNQIQQKMLTENEARSIALKDNPNGVVTKSKLDNKMGTMVYEIDIISENLEKEYEIDAYTGKILKMETEFNMHHNNMMNNNMMKHDNNMMNNKKNIKNQISMEQAKEIALKNSAKNGKLKSIELDFKHGRKVYEIEVAEGFAEREFLIDAETGEILRSKKDF